VDDGPVIQLSAGGKIALDDAQSGAFMEAFVSALDAVGEVDFSIVDRLFDRDPGERGSAAEAPKAPEDKGFMCELIASKKKVRGLLLVADRPSGYASLGAGVLAPFVTTAALIAESYQRTWSLDVMKQDRELATTQLEARAKSELNQARRQTFEAERVSRAKTELLWQMSQEMQAPVTAILDLARGLEASADLGAPHLARVKNIVAEGRRVVEMIDEVVDLSRLEAGAVSLSNERVVIGEVVDAAAGALRAEASRRGIAISVNARRAAGIDALGDRRRLSQVLESLIANAVRYNVDGGHVDVVCEETPPGRASIQVRDTGPGLSIAQQRRLFHPFDRLGAERSGVPGKGLGLAIAKQLVEMMGGSIDVESEPGMGSTFWVDLPGAPRARARPG
jgi:signal transduction histidine kinase